MPIREDLLLHMLLGGGAALSGQPWAKAVASSGQQHLAAKGQYTMLDLFKKILSGEGGKVTMDDKGVSSFLPKTQLKGLLDSDYDPLDRGPAPAPETPGNEPTSNLPVQGMGRFLNP